MTTPFYSASCKAGSGVQPKANLALCAVTDKYTVAAVPLTADVIHMVKIPAGATVLEVILATTDLDAGTDLLLSVGYTGELTAFIDSSAVGQAGGVARANGVGLGHKFTANDTIQVSVTLQGATTDAGTICLSVLYTMDP
jgi:hypothetical protein